MIRLRHLATLLLVTAFAVFQLLATAPLLHSPHCESLESLTLAKHQREAPAFRGEAGAAPRSGDECPVCMVSGLTAILSPGLAVFAPMDHLAAPHLTPGDAVRARVSENLRSRAPPAV
ncbi:MAG TPA: hypothetical protein VGH73_25845 [Thermoanaerobaculia bacterium]|jgi:hypothetical protein